VTARWSQWGGASGVVLFVLWAPMALVLLQLPDLATPTEVERFYAGHRDLVRVVSLPVSVGFLFFLCFLGTLVGRLRQAEASCPLTGIAFGSALMFMTSLNIAVGLVATADLLSGSSPPETVHAVHTAAFVIAAPVAPAGAAFFAAVAAASFNVAAFPRWLAWGAVLAALANVGALGGLFSLTGPLNAANGIVGGPAIPVAAWVVWILLASLELMHEDGRKIKVQPTGTSS
jgi:hypothetical protein